MEIKALIEKLFLQGKQAGLEEMEIYIQNSEQLKLKVFKNEIDMYTISDSSGLSLRGIYQGKMGYSYTEKIDETSIELLVQEVISNAKTVDSDDEEYILGKSPVYQKVDSYNECLAQVPTEVKILNAKSIEAEAMKVDPRVTTVDYCEFAQLSNHTVLTNTTGLDLEEKSNLYYGYLSVVVTEGQDVKTGERYILSNDYTKLDPKALAEEAVYEAISMLNAKSISSGDYEVILRNNVSASILDAFTPIFSAENVQKNMSLLKDKLNEKIATPLLNIVDDPFMVGGAASSSFDGEGVATTYKKLVDQGILKTYLHNTKTAKKDGVNSTGNAHKASYKSPISIAPTNMYIERGSDSLEDLIKSIDHGLIIIDVQGLHSGLNSVSGDFSLSAHGYEIKNGSIFRPVNQITIAGNYFELLHDILSVGNDLHFGIPFGHGYIGSPSLKIKKLAVSGE